MLAVIRTVDEDRRWEAEPKIQRSFELRLCTTFNPNEVDLAPVLLRNGLEQLILRLAPSCHVIKDVREEGDEAHVLSPAGAVKRSLGHNLLNAKRHFPCHPL